MDTPQKIRKVLKILSFAFLVVLIRVWHLGVIEREEKLLDAQKPQRRTVLIKAPRGTIVDRYQIPMAINQISYNAALYYSQIAEIPKAIERKEYIRNLSVILSKTLQMDPERIEDLIHSKASLFPHAPFLLKSNLSEEEHYRLKMLEKEWPGICAEIASARFYPLGKVGCHLLGSMGAITRGEYNEIAFELKELQLKADLFESSDFKRLEELKEKAYSMNDLVGKTGLEAQYEGELRGFFGKKIFEVDQKGRFVKDLTDKEAISGKQLVLSISSELQRFAEDLLCQNERERDGKSIWSDPKTKTRKVQKQPWIKGGAIVALDPNTGEVLAMASYPRYDPNDFIFSAASIFSEGKVRQIHRWLETEQLIADLWDGHEVLKRETPKNFQEEAVQVSWEFYLDQILPKESPIRTYLDTVKGAIQLQEDFEAMLYFTKLGQSVPPDIQKRLDQIALPIQDKAFAADLCKLAIYAPAFTDALIERVGPMKIGKYRSLCKVFLRKEREIKKEALQAFRKNQFREWREKEEKSFLKEKRKEEKEKKSYVRPLVEYLDKKEKELFATHWEEKKWALLANEEMPEELIRTFRPFSELKGPLFGKYRGVKCEKDLAAAFYPTGGFGFSRSYALECPVPPGSIFKLVTAYEALRQKKQLTLIDQITSHAVAFSLNGTPYPRHYKGGRLPRSAGANLGKLDLLSAIERSSNPYFSILAGDFFGDPEDLGAAARAFGFGEKTGIDFPREKRGNIPNDLRTHRTGLYSSAIGQHTLLTTPLQTAVMLASLANGGKVLKPKLVKEVGGITRDQHPLSLFAAPTYLAKEELNAIGIPFPLFTAMQPRASISEKKETPIEVKRILPMDEKIRGTLLEGMDRVVSGAHGSARASHIRSLIGNPIAMREYLALEHQMVAKTGTAEIVLNLSKNPSSPPQIYKYIWFGGISFKDLKKTAPELVVTVFLRFGDSGKEAAPLAAQMIHKWRELQKKHSTK